MLIGFNVGNFLSFSEIQHFSMVSAPHEDMKDHVVQCAGLDLLRGSFIYGANAAGKSNLVKAFAYSRDIILGDSSQIYCFGDVYLSHCNHDVPSKEPCYFEYVISVKNQIFSYGIEVDSDSGIMQSEWLFQTVDGSEQVIFAIDRGKGGESEINVTSLKQQFIDFIESVRDFTFLSFISHKDVPGIETIKDIYSWFRNSLIIMLPEVSDYSMIVDDNFVNNLVSYLNHLDTGICDYARTRVLCIKSIEWKKREVLELDEIPYVMYKDVNINGSMRWIPVPDEYSEIESGVAECLITNAKQGKRCILYSNGDIFEFYKEESKVVCDEISFKHGSSLFPLSFRDESQGTRRLAHILSMFIMLSPASSDELCAPGLEKLFVIDELECSIHTSATQELVKMFCGISRLNCCQLITTTHESRLLDKKYVRRDEVWFVESSIDENDRFSTLYSLETFDDINEKHFDNAYLVGRYGAIPSIGMSDRMGEDY